MDYFRRFFKNIKKLRVRFSRVLTKNNGFGIFEKIFKNFFENSTKNALSLSMFKEISNPCVKLSRVLTRNIIVSEIFDIFSKIS